MFRINDIVCFKNANKWGTREWKITDIRKEEVVLDNHMVVPSNLLVLC